MDEAKVERICHTCDLFLRELATVYGVRAAVVMESTDQPFALASSIPIPMKLHEILDAAAQHALSLHHEQLEMN
jgi:hypothetical protein